jgi:release factor glutamine methyltransferase
MPAINPGALAIMNIQQALQQASQALSETSPSAKLDAQVLLTHILQCNTAHLAAWPEKNLSEEQAAQYLQLTQQRKDGQPVAHLTGTREFWSLAFAVNDSTLIPRPETETLIEFILENFRNKKKLKLLDMGAGTGAIAISIASEKPGWKIFASEVSEQALVLARKNSERHQTGNITFMIMILISSSAIPLTSPTMILTCCKVMYALNHAVH